MDPVYVYCPPWRPDSAGIRVLHELCDLLNGAGLPAWLVVSSPRSGPLTSYSLNTPVLSQDLADDHAASGAKPIVVYSETVPGNPLGAQRIVRYILNFPGLLGGATNFPAHEVPLAFSARIAEAIGDCPTLFIPPVDIEELDSVGEASAKSHVSVVYAVKYRVFVGPPDLTGLPAHVEIHRGGKSGQSRSEVLGLLRAAPVLYCFENSTIAAEAILLGTPVVFMRSQFLKSVIAEEELGRFGWCWSDEPDGLQQAMESLPLARTRYLEVRDSLPDRVVDLLPTFAGVPSKPCPRSRIRVPKEAPFISRHRIALGIQAFRHFGPRGTWRITRDFARRQSWN